MNNNWFIINSRQPKESNNNILLLNCDNLKIEREKDILTHLNKRKKKHSQKGLLSSLEAS